MATGAMLQGFGTLVGAAAVIVAALVGGTTFRAWRRQQLVQRHMALAEKILIGIFNAKEELAAARSPMMLAWEMDQASKKLEENGFDLAGMETRKADRLKSGQAYLMRIDRFRDTWKGLEESKAAAYAFFGGDLPKEIDRLLRQVHIFRIDAEGYAQDDGSDREFTKRLRSTLSSSRIRDGKDELATEVDSAIAAIEARLQPFLRDVASETQKAVAEGLRSTASALLTKFTV